jgi:hypothetical protein
VHHIPTVYFTYYNDTVHHPAAFVEHPAKSVMPTSAPHIAVFSLLSASQRRLRRLTCGQADLARGDEAQPDGAGGRARAAESDGGDTGGEKAEPPRRHGPGRGGTEWPASGAMAGEPCRARGVLGAEAGDRVGEAGSRGRAGLDGGERRGWRSGPASRAGLREGAGPASRAGVGWRWLRRVSGRAHGAATRRRATAVDSSEKRKREEEKKGRRATGDEADFTCGAHVRNGAFYGTGRGR